MSWVPSRSSEVLGRSKWPNVQTPEDAVQESTGTKPEDWGEENMLEIPDRGRETVVAEISSALLKDVTKDCYSSEANPWDDVVFKEQFNEMLIRFFEKAGPVVRSISHGSKGLPALKLKLLNRCCDDLHAIMDKHTRSRHSGIPDNISIPQYPDISIGTFGWSAKDGLVLRLLKEHIGFSELRDSFHKLVERRFCDQNELIDAKIRSEIERREFLGELARPERHAEFSIDWNIELFLDTCYPLHRTHRLGSIIALTGTRVNARLTTVKEYFREVWPKFTWEVLDALSAAVREGVSEYRAVYPHVTELLPIQISLENNTVKATGTIEFLITVGQQLAWLGAVFRCSPSGLSHCYTNFTPVNETNSKLPYVTFSLEYEVMSLDRLGTTSCWNDLVGDVVLVAGFPIPKRPSDAVGLEASLVLIGALADIPLATCYRGGFILKGRSIALVPIRRGESFVQWHLYQKESSRVSYLEIQDMFPNRLLLEDLNENALTTTRAFLGWCPRTCNHLASSGYDYQSVRYTKTPYLSKSVLSLTGGSIGFQQFGAGNLNFALSTKHGIYHRTRAQYFEDLLDDAKQIPIVLQDMQDRRAVYTDGELVILHIILHREALTPFDTGLSSASPSDPQSIRQAMLDNADIPVAYDRNMWQPGQQLKTFKYLVNELYTILEGLMAESMNVAEVGLELNFDWKKHVRGWEYMDLVNRKLTPRLREAELKPTCGQWPELIRDKCGIVLFANGFQNIITPEINNRLCRKFQELPKGQDYLAIESAKVEQMYQESGAANDRTQITVTGLTFQRSTHIFEDCSQILSSRKECECERIQRLVSSQGKGKLRPLPELYPTGAIIMGQGDNNLTDWVGQSWNALRRVFKRRSWGSETQTASPIQESISSGTPQANLPNPDVSCTENLSDDSSNVRSPSTTTTFTPLTKNVSGPNKRPMIIVPMSSN